jgi:hypothetical protein
MVMSLDGALMMNPDYQNHDFLISLDPEIKKVRHSSYDELVETYAILSIEHIGYAGDGGSVDMEGEDEVNPDLIGEEGLEDAPNPVLESNVSYTVTLLDYSCLDFCELTFVYQDEFTYTYVMAADNFPMQILHHDNEYGWTISDAYLDAKASIIIGEGEAANPETGENYNGEAVISVKLMN